jgi:glycosyltransferase involved in cell wall biosynthesis
LLREFRATHVLCHGNKALKLATHTAVRAGLPGCKVVAVTHNYSLKHIRRVDHVLALTGDLARAARDAGVGAGQLTRIGNLVRVPAKLPSARSAWRDPPVIGSMGRFVAKKGFEVFIEALALLAAQGSDFRAVLGGSGEEERVLKDLAASRGLDGRLQFAGWVDDRQAFYDGIDIAVVPSHHEPFGIVVLEAMAQGLPVVSTASEGPSEILADGQGGQLVPLRDPQALADALAALLADPVAARQRGSAAHGLALRTWDIRPAADRLVAALGAVT